MPACPGLLPHTRGEHLPAVQGFAGGRGSSPHAWGTRIQRMICRARVDFPEPDLPTMSIRMVCLPAMLELRDGHHGDFFFFGGPVQGFIQSEKRQLRSERQKDFYRSQMYSVGSFEGVFLA